jgi:small-conductance mechanosensitive channel
MAFWKQPYFGNPTRAWATALAVTVGVLVVLWILKRIVIKRFYKCAQRTETDIDDMIAEVSVRTKLALLAIPAAYAGSLVLFLPEWITTWFRTVAIIAALIQVAFWGDALIRSWLSQYQKEHIEDEERVTTIKAASLIMRLVLIAIVSILAVDNIPGVEVSALVASLGITGIAVALAVQNILADLFASLSIVLDRPFVIGDVIKVGDLIGTVEQIGLKTTRVRSITGEELVFSNNDLLGSRIRNYKSLAKRLVIFSVGVTYQTPAEKLEKIPALLEEAVRVQEKTQFGRAHLKEFGDSSLNFEVLYHVDDPDFNLYMDVKQAIILAIVTSFSEEGIQFAYPTQMLYVSQEGHDS